MIVNPKELLIDARKNGKALGHFNVFNFESSKAVIDGVEEINKPAFVAITETTIRYIDLDVIANCIKEYSKRIDTDIILHLDHGKSLEVVKKCIKAGFSSVMIDGSALHFEENIKLTKTIVAYAKPHGVAVEAELGHVGRVGEVVPKHYLTVPKRAAEFVLTTKVDSLAVAIGTIHGLVKKMAIDFERLGEIQRLVKTPLVIHGGTGLNNEDIRRLISFGVAKINIDTSLRIAFMRGLRQNIIETDPRKALTTAMDEVKMVVKDFMEKFE